MVNGGLTDSWEIQKGTRQGYPRSPLLFILMLESLNRDIRQDNRVKGLQIEAHKYKLHAFADDKIFILQDP